jgi:UDP-N-acetylglucosamine 2-epimerase (non-hydrolysing)
MKKLKIISVVGARPNFVKIAVFAKEIAKAKGIKHLLVHTGQHYDAIMSAAFFKDLNIPSPDINLGVRQDSHASQTAEIMQRFEKVCLSEKPEIVVVVGDVNSTLACALTAAKLGIKVAHIEAGLRSFDRSMPEEINRIVTDSISDYLFVTEESGIKNLLKEGHSRKKTFLVGNTMIDTLIAQRNKTHGQGVFERFNLKKNDYVLVTLHRPSNVDQKASLKMIVRAIQNGAGDRPVLFPVHPRTRRNMALWKIRTRGVRLTEPLGYRDFLALVKHAAVVVTDSGGIQEETSFLGIPCVTVRNNTERPITLTHGTNMLAGTSERKIMAVINKSLYAKKKKRFIPYWDGNASRRIVAVLNKRY